MTTANAEYPGPGTQLWLARHEAQAQRARADALARELTAARTEVAQLTVLLTDADAIIEATRKRVVEIETMLSTRASRTGSGA